MITVNNLQQWFLNTSLGNYTLALEEQFYHNSTANIFGYYSLQIGMSKIDLLSNNKISRHYILGRDINFDLQFLPFANCSIDLIACPHTLECTNNYHYLLEECHRVLIPKGKIIITNFNPKSMFSLFKNKFHEAQTINYISLNTLKQKLIDVNLQISGGKFFNYILPINNPKWLNKLVWLEKFGDRWIPNFANSYAIIATKEMVTPMRITPKKNRVKFALEMEPNLGITQLKQRLIR